MKRALADQIARQAAADPNNEVQVVQRLKRHNWNVLITRRIERTRRVLTVHGEDEWEGIQEMLPVLGDGRN